MLSQNATMSHFATQHAGTCFIKGSESHIASKLVAFCDTRRKITLSTPITSRTAWIPRAALTDKIIPDNDKRVFSDWHSSCLLKCELGKSDMWGFAKDIDAEGASKNGISVHITRFLMCFYRSTWGWGNPQKHPSKHLQIYF